MNTKSNRLLRVFAVVAVAVISFAMLTSAGAQSITTLFGSNNNGSPGGAVYFDANIGSNSLSINSFDINTDISGSFSNFQVWILAGMTSQGNETSPLWTEVATGSGTGAGIIDSPTHVTLSNSFTLDASGLYGIALVMDPGGSHFYTNGTGSNQNYSNGDLSLALGSATNVPFTQPVFSPRVWNGTIYYTVVPEPSPMAFLAVGALGLVVALRFRRGRRVA